MGIEDAPKVAIIFIGTFFQQVLIIANTTRRIDPALLEAAETLGASRRALITKVVLPGIVVDVYTDMRVLLGWAWTYLIVAELIGVSSGITYFINQQGKYRAYDRVFASIILIGLIGLGTDLVLASLGRQLFPWMKTAREGWFSKTLARMRRGGRQAPPASASGAAGSGAAEEVGARMSTETNPAAALAVPSYRDQAPEVAARFARIKQRPVILEVDDSLQELQRARPPADSGARSRLVPGAPPRAHVRDRAVRLRQVDAGARLVAGLEPPTGGQMLLDGKPIHGPGSDRGMVFQSYTLFPWLTVLRNVMFGMEVGSGMSSSEAEQEARMWLEVVGLTKFAAAYPHQLSGGMKQRAAIARALANRPRMLLMDEPFGALDAQTRCQMQSYLLQIWRQVDITILFITHDLDEAVYLADRILILDAHPGRVREVMEVAVPRPRSAEQFLSPAFIAARHHLEELIHPRAAQAADKLPVFRMTVVGDEVE